MKVNELKAEIVRNGYNIETFADATGIARTTMWRRFKNPNELTLKEIGKMSDVLKLSQKRIIEIFFADNVA